MDETAAILACRQGDDAAFRVLFDRHAAHVYRVAYLIVRDEERAEDIAQDTFLILLQRLPGLAAGPLHSWLGRVAANLSLNDRRRARELPFEGLSLARFGSARALARSLRRAHGRAPWPLRALAWPLFVVGLLGLALVALMGQSLLWIGTHDPSSYFFISLQRSGTAFLPAMTNWIRPLAPVLILAVCAVGSLLFGARVLRGGLRRRRLVAACLGLLTVLDGAIIVVFLPLLLPQHLINPASWTMPDLAPLARAGLVSSPDPHQPVSPVRVDLVATSPAGTYVVYTISDPLHAGEGWGPLLFDARGTAYPSEGGGSTYTSGPLSLLPWRPAAEGFMRFPPLPPGMRTAVLRFWRPGDQALGPRWCMSRFIWARLLPSAWRVRRSVPRCRESRCASSAYRTVRWALS